jgi:hypothetical protein
VKTTGQLSPSAAGVLPSAAICAAAAALVLATTALAVVATGLADDARRELRFAFGGVDKTPAEAARIALHNATIAAGTVLGAAARPRIPAATRPVLDAVLAALLAVNAAAVGVAFGAYGTRIATAIALHLPLELAAFSLAGGAYMQACEQPLSTRTLGAVAALSAVLLIAAATLETCAPLGGLR